MLNGIRRMARNAYSRQARFLLSAALTAWCATASTLWAQSTAPSVAHGEYHTCAVNSSGAVLCWGFNLSGQLGNGSNANTTAPVAAVGLTSGATQVTAGTIHSCALTTSGSVLCWGYNGTGQLGIGTTVDRNTPTLLPNLSFGVSAISAGWVHTCALLSSGGVRCWGNNSFGQLGNGSNTDSTVPVDVTGLGGTAIAISSGGYHSCALMTDRTVRCWGRNFNGQLGNGDFNDTNTPVTVTGLGGVASLAGGGLHSCAVTQSGGAKCWGFNNFLQLGDGTGNTRSQAGDVLGLTSGVARMAAGRHHTCALTTGGAVKCWGDNDFGQLGDGTLIDRSVPVDVIGLAAGVIGISASDVHTGALTSDGGVTSWGGNLGGQLGEGTFATRPLPQQVLGLNGAGFLDLSPENGLTPPASRKPSFGAVSSGLINTATTSTVTTNIQFRPQDVGTSGSIYVFVLAPANRVQGAAAPTDAKHIGVKTTGKAEPLACVLAQISANGQLTPATASNLQAFFTGVLGSQGASVTVLNNISSAILSGSVVFVGYGPNAAAALNNLNRPVATVPGTETCQPQSPQTGWWWNPNESGRGFSIEVVGSTLVLSGYIYNGSGQPTWFISAGQTSQDGSFYNGTMDTYRGGQTLGGSFRANSASSSLGAVTLAFTNARKGTLIWPGGSVPIERLDSIIPEPVGAPPVLPESGIWHNAQEPGRGFFMEFKNNFAAVTGYMYDNSGNPVWYLANQSMVNSTLLQTNWNVFSNGQGIGSVYRAPTSTGAGSMSIQFTSRSSAIMTFPNGSQTTLTRFRF
ncbi:MAG: hypothetical protein SF172_03930 [Burkholderiales bacterium]|nr:hypothetical protein [Burkholderiales bacterium]